MGPRRLPQDAGICRALPAAERKYPLLLTLLGYWQSEGQGFDPPQLHQSYRSPVAELRGGAFAWMRPLSASVPPGCRLLMTLAAVPRRALSGPQPRRSI